VLRSMAFGFAAAGVRAEALSPTAQQAAAPEIVIRGGRVVNADGTIDADVRIVGETISEVGPRLAPGSGATVVDAKGRFVTPGGMSGRGDR